MNLIRLYFDDWDGNRPELIIFSSSSSYEEISRLLNTYKSGLIDYNYEEFIEYLRDKGVSVEIPNVYDLEF